MLEFLIKIKEKARIRTRIKKGAFSLQQTFIPLNDSFKRAYIYLFGQFHKKTILFIIGVQRSGTSALFHNLSADKRIKAYNEFSELSSEGDEKLRLHPLPKIKKQINKNIQPIILLKPLVETQNTINLLKTFQNSRAIWMYRHYKDVANSNLNKFGINNGIKNLTPLMNEDYDNWRADGVSNEVRDIVKKHYALDMKPHDAAALFWYVRSRFYFDLGFKAMEEILLIRYEDFALNPNRFLIKIYNHIGQDLPRGLEDNTINSKSIQKGKDVNLSPEIEELCESLYQQFETEFYNLSKKYLH